MTRLLSFGGHAPAPFREGRVVVLVLPARRPAGESDVRGRGPLWGPAGGLAGRRLWLVAAGCAGVIVAAAVGG